jgi:HK97 family phage major capsid protein
VNYAQMLNNERVDLTEMSKSLFDKAAAEERDLTEAEKTQMANWAARCAEIDPQLVAYGEQLEAAQRFADLQSKLEAHREKRNGNGNGDGHIQRTAVEHTSPGQAFVESEEFRSYPGRGQGRAFEISGYTGILEQRAPITTSMLAIPNMVLPPRVPDISIPPLLQVVDVVGTSAGVVEWVLVSGDPQAVVTPEGTAKTEAVLTFTPVSAPLDTIAHWSQITRQALEDASYIRSVVEGKLRRGLLLQIADSINDALVAATIPTATVPVNGTLLEAIRVGIGTVQMAGYQPNAVILNPADWAALDVTVYSGTLNGPTIGQTFWGLTPVPSRFQTAGIALVGDFRAGVAYFDRNVSNVFVTDSHADNFIKNILVILAETRGKAAVPEPNALCECSVAPVE